MATILNSVWSLSACNSKIAKIGLEPKEEFHPYLWISKAGATPVPFSVADFTALINFETLITSYFCTDGEVSGGSSIEIAKQLFVRFDKTYMAKMVVIERVTVGAPRNLEVCWMAKSTWNQFVDLFPCIQRELENLTNCRSEVQRLVDAIAANLWEHSSEKLRTFIREEIVAAMKKVVNSLQFDTEHKFDFKRALLELTATCPAYLLYYAQKKMAPETLVKMVDRN